MACICREIYESALRLIGEPSSTDVSADYEERAPYIMAIFCCEAKALDALYREGHSYEAQTDFNEICLGLDENFPLSARFYPIAVHYMAAMLVIDEDTELSDKFFEKYCTSMMSVRTEIPMIREQIVQQYE